jgi:hypothetical protein
MKYIVLTYEGNDSQMVIEALGPETVLGMVADVMRGNYTSGAGKKVVKIEIGDMIDMGRQWRIPYGPVDVERQGAPSVASGASG